MIFFFSFSATADAIFGDMDDVSSDDEDKEESKTVSCLVENLQK